MDSVNNTTSPSKELKDGYDLPVYGLDSGTFYYLHIPALFCIFCSSTCVIIALILSFRQKDYKTFFSWTKSERFVVYLAICDGGFNVSHSMDHLQYIITKDHVRPSELCEFYGFMLVEFIVAQVLMVNVIAGNAFTLMVFKKKLDFGKHDWRLLVWTYVLPFVGATVVAVTGQLGPTGSYCLFDGVKAEVTNIAFTTVPLALVLCINIVMYGITLYKIRVETKSLQLGVHTRNSNNKAKRAAKNMSMFVFAFFVQWGPLAFYGIWNLISDETQLVMFHIVTVFSNIGGCLNLGVYLIMRHKSSENKHGSKEDTQHDSNEIKAICSVPLETNNQNVKTIF